MVIAIVLNIIYKEENMVTTHDLIKRGYFPAELVPPFNTVSLSEIIPIIEPHLDDLLKPKERRTSKCCSHSIPKVKHFRRSLGIPHPLHQIKFSKAISDRWTEISDFLAESNYSLSRPEIDSKRALKRAFGFGQLSKHKTLRSSGARFVLKTDISRYYASIYTHSISWAIHTKSVAKMNRTDLSLLGNLLDKCVQNTQDGQTSGIPVGPDTSLVISELLGAAFDKQLMGLNLKDCIRYIDDYFLYFSNLADAEYALSKLHTIMREYELELNPNKTEIIALPEILEPRWIYELRVHNFRTLKAHTENIDIISFFSKAFDYATQNPDDNVLKYALRKIADLRVKLENWELYESLLLKSIISEPSVLPLASEIFKKYKSLSYNLNYERIKDTLCEIITYHSKLNHGFELAWALWMSKELQLEILEEAAKALSYVEDSVVALIALDLVDVGLITTGLDKGKWQSYVTKDELYGENWLLAYEATMRGWLIPDDPDLLNNDAFFSILKDNNVHFYDNSLGLVPEGNDDFEAFQFDWQTIFSDGMSDY